MSETGSYNAKEGFGILLQSGHQMIQVWMVFTLDVEHVKHIHLFCTVDNIYP